MIGTYFVPWRRTARAQGVYSSCSRGVGEAEGGEGGQVAPPRLRIAKYTAKSYLDGWNERAMM